MKWWYLLALACGAVIGVRVEIRRRRIADADAKVLKQLIVRPVQKFSPLTAEDYERVLREAERRRGRAEDKAWDARRLAAQPLQADLVDKVARFGKRIGRVN